MTRTGVHTSYDKGNKVRRVADNGYNVFRMLTFGTI